MPTNPITPPQELTEQWADMLASRSDHAVFTMAAQWGADQELEACCALMDDWGLDETDLRFARRPKPPSLKEQAFQALCRFQAAEGHESCTEEEIVDDCNTIRRALEALDD